MIYNYKYILLTNVCLLVGEGSINRYVSRDESVETVDGSIKNGDESIEAGEKHLNHFMIPYTCICIYRECNNELLP